MTDPNLILKQLTQSLASRNLMPKNIEVSQSKDFFWVNAFDEVDGAIVSQNVNAGMADSLAIATLKSVTERIERHAFIEGAANKLSSCNTTNSDGFAAMPTASQDFITSARTNALNEAIERYVWATWWDDLKTGYQVEIFDIETIVKKLGPIKDLFLDVNKAVPLKQVYEIRPRHSLEKEKQVVILIAELEAGGVVSGGSCEDSHNSDTYTRAASELIRHLFAISKSKKENLTPKSFYEQRLFFFASAQGDKVFKNRIATQGTSPIQLPKLVIDEEVPHKAFDLIYVHRCLFENQPPFVGGKLERLCL